MDAHQQFRLWKAGAAADLRASLGSDFTLSADAKRISFVLGTRVPEAVKFDVALADLRDGSGGAGDLAPAITDTLPIKGWKDGTGPTIGTKTLVLDETEMAHSLAIRPDGTGFALGSDFSLRAFDQGGRQMWKRPVPSIVWGVNISADGRKMVAAYADGTVRWHRWSGGQELLALFVDKSTKAWVAWTPSGYYMASPGGEDLIGWQVNRGWEQPADFFPASRFRDKYARPDIVQRVLETLDEAEAVRLANVEAKRHDDARPIIERLPPVLTVLSPSDDAEVATRAVEIRYAVRLPSGGVVDRVEAFVDGSKVAERGFAKPSADGSGTIAVSVPAHDATVSVVAYAGSEASDPVAIRLHRRAADSEEARKPVLYALLVGVSQYEDADLNLGYPAKDATELADALKIQAGRLYADVQVKILVDKDATSTAVRDGLLWLRSKASEHDLEVFFVAGHGLTDTKGKFWFLTHDADPARILSTAVSRDDITGVLYDLPGKKLIFLDACHSGAALDPGVSTRGLGKVDVNTAVNDFAQAEGGVVAYAASTGREVSYERDEWRHGAFTKALIEGLGGQADLLHKGIVTTSSLDTFLADRVKVLTDNHQHPVMSRPKTVPDFPLAEVR